MTAFEESSRDSGRAVYTGSDPLRPSRSNFLRCEISY
jgi:hypothetical protein